jgi:hypothetical protein
MWMSQTYNVIDYYYHFMLLFELYVMMSSYITVVYVNCWSWHIHGSHSICLLKPGVTPLAKLTPPPWPPTPAHARPPPRSPKTGPLAKNRRRAPATGSPSQADPPSLSPLTTSPYQPHWHVGPRSWRRPRARPHRSLARGTPGSARPRARLGRKSPRPAKPGIVVSFFLFSLFPFFLYKQILMLIFYAPKIVQIFSKS